jgi:DNA polymerase-3 subunit delta
MKRIIEDIRSGQFKKVYILYGDERYMLNVYLKKLLTALGASEDNMNYTKFEGKQAQEEAVIETCDTMPFFAERRVVLIEDSGLLKEKNEKLAGYLAELPDYLTLIFSEREIDKRGRLYKAAAVYDGVVEFKAPDEKDITNWIVAELKKNGKKIRRSVLEEFMNGCGTDMGYIACELEKLISYCGSREEITADDIKEICSPQIENRIFEMISDMAAGKRERALAVYNELLLLKEPPMKMMALMERQFRQLLDMRQLMSGGQGEKIIAQTLGMHPYAVKKNMPLARKYKEKEIRDILEEMIRFDEDIKSGRLNDRIAVELLLVGSGA